MNLNENGAKSRTCAGRDVAPLRNGQYLAGVHPIRDAPGWLGELPKGAFVCDQSGIRIIGIVRLSVCLGAILIPEYLDFPSGYSAPRSRIARIYSGIYSYSGISQTNASLVCLFTSFLNRILEIKNGSEISSLLYALRAAIYSLFLPYSTIWRNVLIH